MKTKFGGVNNQGETCDGKWIKSTMRNICAEDKPEGYDPKKNKFLDQWLKNFCKRFKISSQKKTNNKNHSVYERAHMVKNYHYYVIYKLGKETHKALRNYHTTF